MPFLILSAILLVLAFWFIGSTFSVVLLVIAQLLLLIMEVKKGQASGAGAFVFMSFLFFGIRPLYIIIESDYTLFHSLFLVDADLHSIGYAMCLAALGLWVFSLAVYLFPRVHKKWLLKRKFFAAQQYNGRTIISAVKLWLIVLLQIGSLPLIIIVARLGPSLYAAGAGAYAYDLPVPLQAIHVFSVVAMTRNFLARRSAVSIIILISSVTLLLVFTWFMREVSIFRGYYLSGLIIAFIAVIQQLRGRVGYRLLILAIVFAQPSFAKLGDNRRLTNNELLTTVFSFGVEGQSPLAPYWDFYDSNGDMNIFDTFLAASKSEPSFFPYIWSWLYAPLHFIPRQIWPDKPYRGVTQDVSFMNGAPYAPGIIGFFLLDGGPAWMLLSMFGLGYSLTWLDIFVLTMKPSILQASLIGIVVVNGMFLTRFFYGSISPSLFMPLFHVLLSIDG
jgi:hypothetical protein